MEYVIIFFGCVIGGTLNIVCGFGVGVFCMMFLPYVMHSTNTPAALINIVTVYQSAWVTLHYWRSIRWKLILPPLIGYFIASAIAVRLAVQVDFQFMKRVLGVFLVALSVYCIFFSQRLRLRPTVGNGLAAGAVGGVLSGLFAVGGPPAAMYFSSTTDEKDAYLANLQGYYFFSCVYVVFVRAVNGVITKQLLLYCLPAVAGMALGSLLGHKAFQRANEQFILRAMYVMMAVSGVVMLLS